MRQGGSVGETKIEKASRISPAVFGTAPTSYCTGTTCQFENNYFREMCSGSEAGSYSRLIDCVYHSTLGLRVIKKKKNDLPEGRVFIEYSVLGHYSTFSVSGQEVFLMKGSYERYVTKSAPHKALKSIA